MRFALFCLALSVFTTVAFSAVSSWSTYLETGWLSESNYEDLESLDTSVEEQSLKVGFEGSSRLEAGQFSWNLDYEALEADWQNGGFYSFAQGNLYDEAELLSASLLWNGLLEGAWNYSLFLGTESHRATEGVFETVSISDALAYQAGAALNYRFNDDLMVGFGFRYSGSPADVDEQWYPIVQVYWQINEAWTLRTLNGVQLLWQPAETSLDDEVTFSALWKSRTVHLGTRAMGAEQGYEDEAIALGLGYRLTLSENFSIEPEIAYLFAREMTLWNGGRKAWESDLESTWTYGIRFAYRF